MSSMFGISGAEEVIDRRYRDPAKSVVERHPNKLIVVHQHPGLMNEPHWHAQFEINFLFRGSVRYRFDDRIVDISADQVALFWGGLPHQMIDTSPDSLFIAIHLPLVHFFRLRLSGALTRRLMHGAAVITRSPEHGDRAQFDRWSTYMRSNEPARVDHAISELLLRIDRIQFEPYVVHEPRGLDDDPDDSWDEDYFGATRKICGFIADNFCEDIDVSAIADAADIHAKTAMRLFKKATGMTLHKYLSLFRLSYAQAMLMNDDKSIVDIAMESGFGSLGAFNTSFARLAGKSPSQFRRDARTIPILLP